MRRSPRTVTRAPVRVTACTPSSRLISSSSAAGAGPRRAEQLERLAHPQPVRQRGLLELAAYQRPQLGGLRRRVEAEHAQPPGVGLAQPLDAFDGGRLAGPVSADQSDDLAGR